MYQEGRLEQARRRIYLDIQGLGLVLPDHNAYCLF